jgi:hypothetical protein
MKEPTTPAAPAAIPRARAGGSRTIKPKAKPAAKPAGKGADKSADNATGAAGS